MLTQMFFFTNVTHLTFIEYGQNVHKHDIGKAIFGKNGRGLCNLCY